MIFKKRSSQSAAGKIKSSLQKISQQVSDSLLNDKSSSISPTILTPGQHPVIEQNISSAAVKVLRKLSDAGFEAYLVGGCIRDSLVGLQPKDFDIATDATPEELVDLFQRAQIIGRRFRIVHIRYGREVVEVTTFRGHHSSKNSKQSKHTQKHCEKSGMLLRDNVYGTIEEDAIRRDFTVNALYYNLINDNIYDYVESMTDIESRQINIIGDPEQRYREDPVRMLRAIRLAAKLDFKIEEQTASAIGPLKQLLKDIPPARLFDESLKLFMHGYAKKTFLTLQSYDLFGVLFPGTSKVLEKHPEYQHFLEQAFINTDERIRSDKRVTPAYLFAALLWPVFNERIKQLQAEQQCAPYQVFYPAAESVIEQCVSRISLPRRFSTPLKEIWQLQYRLERRHGNYAEKAFQHKRFRAAYDFVLLRESTGEDLSGLGQWWTDYQEADETQRKALVQSLPAPQKSPRKRKRKRQRQSDRSKKPNNP